MGTVSDSNHSPPLTTLDDLRLIELARGGDQRAFEELVHRHHRRLLSRARRIASRDAAEDVVQNALLSAWLALQRGTDVRDVRPWLEGIVRNAALRSLPAVTQTTLPETLGAGEESEPAAALDRRQQLRDALAALGTLPELQRTALLQTAFDGESYESAASSLGVNQSTVRGLVYRARATMRTAMGALIPFPLLSWLRGRRVAVVRRVSATLHPVAPASTGGAGALAAKGAVVLVVAASGVGAAHLLAGHSPAVVSAGRASLGSGRRAGSLGTPDALRAGSAAAPWRGRRHDAGSRPAAKHSRPPRAVSSTNAAPSGGVLPAARSTTTTPVSTQPAAQPPPAQITHTPSPATTSTTAARPPHGPAAGPPSSPAGTHGAGSGSTSIVSAAGPTGTSPTDTTSASDTTSTTDTTTSTTDATNTTDTTSTTTGSDRTSTTDATGTGPSLTASAPSVGPGS